jgi:radical SAM protein with 4Fe4S-binding SPASM domain
MSIDGATKETYEKLQVGSNFERVIANVKNMVLLKKKMKSNFPEICFHFIVTKENFYEMPLFIKLVYSIDPDPKIINLVQFTKIIPFKENSALAPQVDEKVVNEALNLAKEFGNFRVDSFRMGKVEKKRICECLDWTVPFITVDGSVYPCCAYTEGNMREIMHKYAMGNVFKEDFKKIWSSDKFGDFKKMIHENKVPIECKIRNCPAYNVE